MKTMQANLCSGRDSLTMFADELNVPVTLNAAGQYTVNVLNFPQPVVTEHKSPEQPTPKQVPPSESQDKCL